MEGPVPATFLLVNLTGSSRAPPGEKAKEKIKKYSLDQRRSIK